MTIHNEHPFLQPESERDPVRRLRGRLGGTVSLWTTGPPTGPRAGLTVSSYMVAPGDPANVVALVDPDSDFADAVRRTDVAVVQLLEWEHQQLAEAFAGRFPAPGGPFRLADWVETDWGPRLASSPSWAGVRRRLLDVLEVGWAQLLVCEVEHVELGDEATPLVHRRGRYERPVR